MLRWRDNLSTNKIVIGPLGRFGIFRPALLSVGRHL